MVKLADKLRLAQVEGQQAHDARRRRVEAAIARGPVAPSAASVRAHIRTCRQVAMQAAREGRPCCAVQLEGVDCGEALKKALVRAFKAEGLSVRVTCDSDGVLLRPDDPIWFLTVHLTWGFGTADALRDIILVAPRLVRYGCRMEPPRPMDATDAHEAAVQRWGIRAYVRDRQVDSPVLRRFCVGRKTLNGTGNAVVYGEGATWEEAFAEATARAAFLAESEGPNQWDVLPQVYTGSLKWVPGRTVLFVRHGSHAYGTNIATSDIDYRGVAMAPKEIVYGLDSFSHVSQKDPDLIIFDFRKFVSLAATCNPNVLEILYVDEKDILQITPIGEQLILARDMFLSQRAVHTFSGYAASQMRRIRGHHAWLMNPPKAPPTRAEFGLPERTLIPKDQLAAAEAALDKKMAEWDWHELDDVSADVRQAVKDDFERRLLELTMWTYDEMNEQRRLSAAKLIGFDDNMIDVLDRERRYTSAKRTWSKFLEWQSERNPARAELEAKFGYDTKHAMHLVRLLRMCREILTTGKMIVKRPDADELLAIRNGLWSYEQLDAWATAEDAELRQIAKQSKLPHAADRRAIDALTIRLVEASLT